MKTTIIAICLILGGFFGYSFSGITPDHDKDGKIKIKIITEKDGTTTVIDTTITFTGEFNESMVTDLLHSLNIDNLDTEGGKCIKKIIVNADGDIQDKNIKVVCLGGDSSMAHMIKCCSFSDDSLIQCCSKQKCTVICDDKGGKKHKKMIIRSGSGNCKELSEEISKEVKIEVDDNGNIKEFTINGENADPGNYNTDIQIINNEDGKKIIIIKAEVKIDDLDESDLKKLENSDVVNTAGKNTLEIEKLDFYPNPNNGKFNLIFTLQEKGKTKVTVFDSNGKAVYKEVLPDFNGTYNKEIDISGKGKGQYFLNIEQGNKVINKKLIIQ